MPEKIEANNSILRVGIKGNALAAISICFIRAWRANGSRQHGLIVASFHAPQMKSAGPVDSIPWATNAKRE